MKFLDGVAVEHFNNALVDSVINRTEDLDAEVSSTSDGDHLLQVMIEDPNFSEIFNMSEVIKVLRY